MNEIRASAPRWIAQVGEIGHAGIKAVGTGIVVDARHVLTCWHVATHERFQSFSKTPRAGLCVAVQGHTKPYEVKSVEFDENNSERYDLALLRVDDEVLADIAPPRFMQGWRRGTPRRLHSFCFGAYGYPMQSGWQPDKPTPLDDIKLKPPGTGQEAAPRNADSDIPFHVQLSANASQGMSGGPVLISVEDPKAQDTCVGFLNIGSDATGDCTMIPADLATAFLERSAVTYKSWNFEQLDLTRIRLASYFDSLTNETRTVTTPFPRKSRPAAIHEFYHPLRMRSDPEGLGGDPTESGDKGSSLGRNLQDALGWRCVVITGSPGQGKTTFLRWVAWALASQEAEADQARGKLPASLPRVPFLIDLHQFAQTLHSRGRTDSNCNSLVAFIEAHLQDHQVSAAQADDIYHVLETEGAVLLFDRLEFVPESGERRKQVVRILELAAERFKRCVFAVARRTHHQGAGERIGGFRHVQIDKLTTTDILALGKKWARTLESTPDESWTKILESNLEIPEVLSLASAPAMALMVCGLQLSRPDSDLPRDKVKLYDRAIQWLSSSRAPNPDIKEIVLMSGLRSLALAMHKGVRSSNESDARPRNVMWPKEWAIEAIAEVTESAGDNLKRGTRDRALAQAEDLLSSAEHQGSFIVSVGPDSKRFWHRGFQEFFVAQLLARVKEARNEIFLCDAENLRDTWWRETFHMVIGLLSESPREQFISNIIGKFATDESEIAQKAEIVSLLTGSIDARFIAEADPENCALRRLVSEVAPMVRGRDTKSLISERVRIAVADASSRLGVDSTGQSPGFVSIQGGEFEIGDERTGKYRCRLEDFEVGRFLVTVAEFREFLDAGGPMAFRDQLSQDIGSQCVVHEEPRGWYEQRINPGRPVWGVNWFEATAFCMWRTEKAKSHSEPATKIRLPSEAEWEATARGESRRIYPWGDHFEPENMNCDGRNGHASPVGIYSSGATPEGVHDLGGNLWEWCLDWQDTYPDNSEVVLDWRGPKRPIRERKLKILRGGSWDSGKSRCRAATRHQDSPNARNDMIGFRVVREFRISPTARFS